MFNTYIAIFSPGRAFNVAKPGTNQHQRRVAVRKGFHYPGPSSDLPTDPVNHIVGPDHRPVLSREMHVRQEINGSVAQ